MRCVLNVWFSFFVFFLQVSWLSEGPTIADEWVCSRCAERFIPSLCFVCGVSGSEWKSVVEVSWGCFEIVLNVFCFFLSLGELWESCWKKGVVIGGVCEDVVLKRLQEACLRLQEACLRCQGVFEAF